MKSGLKIAGSVGGVLVAAGAVAAIALSGGSGSAAPAKAPAPTPSASVAAVRPVVKRPALADRSAPASPRRRHHDQASHRARHQQQRGIIARTKGPVVANPQPEISQPAAPQTAEQPSTPAQHVPATHGGGGGPPVGNPVGQTVFNQPTESPKE